MRSGYVRFHESLEPLMVPIDSVSQHSSNYNNGDVEAIIHSIHAVGMYRPIIVNSESGEILAGNHTWLACKEMGSEVIPVVKVDPDTESDAIKLMIADNRTASLARPDHAQLLDLLTELAENDSIEGTGYTPDDLAAIEELAHMSYDPEEDFASWPTLSFQVPPHVRDAFMLMTREAQGEREAFELLLRLAGWDGGK